MKNKELLKALYKMEKQLHKENRWNWEDHRLNQALGTIIIHLEWK